MTCPPLIPCGDGVGSLEPASASAVGIAGDGGFGAQPVAGSAAWRSYDLCLTGSSSGATVEAGLSVFGTDICDETTFEHETHWIDDIGFVGHAACL